MTARTTRRAFLSATVTTTLASIPAAALALPNMPGAAIASAAHPDAELIGLCGQIIKLEQQFGASSLRNADLLSSDPLYRVEEAEQARLSALQKPILDRIYELPTHTLDGFRARGRAIMSFDHGQLEREQDFQGQLYSLMHDLVAEDGASSTEILRADTPADPDADVLALADQFMVLFTERKAIDAGKWATDDEVADIIAAQATILDTVAEHTVTTPAAHKACARIIAGWYEIASGDDGCPYEIEAHRIWPLFRDLIGGPV